MELVNKWKKIAKAGLRLRGTSSKLTQYKLRSLKDMEVLFHWKINSTSGVWFVSVDGKTIDFLYGYEGIKGLKQKSAEALAYAFTEYGHGHINEVFFDHLLPSRNFVVTDFMYTPDGYKWFKTQYTKAFLLGYKVYAIDLRNKNLEMTTLTNNNSRTYKVNIWDSMMNIRNIDLQFNFKEL